MRNFEELLPDIFKNYMKQLLGKDYEKYIDSLNNSSIRGIRINPIKLNNKNFDDIFPYKTSHVPYEKYGRILETDEKIGNTPFHVSGIIYSQEPSSMLPVSCINVNDDMKVLDLCAAPGGKTTQIAARIPNGLIVSNEIVTNRSKILFSNIERLGVVNAIVTNDTPQNLAENLGGYFDVILVDAPCSGEGMFRKDPDTICEWSEDRISTNSDRQLEILMQAHKCLKTGGIIIYSTCTFSEIEDEDVVLRFLEKYNYEIMDVVQECKEWTTHGTKIVKARRFYPFTGNGEGQFVCVIKKLDECEEFHKPKRLIPEFIKGKDKEILENFLKDNFDIPNWYKFVIVRDEIMAVTQEMLDLIPLKINIINAGVRIGRIEKGILKPHHQVFSAFGKYAKAKIELSQDEFRKYVHGEELDNRTSCTGYACLTIFGAAVGGVKCSGDKLKNMYPKGLRF